MVLVSAWLTTWLCALGACVTLRESMCYTVLVSKDFLKPRVKKLILVIGLLRRHTYSVSPFVKWEDKQYLPHRGSNKLKTVQCLAHGKCTINGIVSFT